MPGILLLIPRTATIGAAALFAVSINITVMDFAYGYPAVRYVALLYTVLLAVLPWADREKLGLLLEDSGRVRKALALLPTVPAVERPAPMVRKVRRALIGGTALLVLMFANILAASLSEPPTVVATRALARQLQPGERIEVLQYRTAGLIGVNWTATVKLAVIGGGAADTVRVRARKVTGFLPWRVEEVVGEEGQGEAGGSGGERLAPHGNSLPLPRLQ